MTVVAFTGVQLTAVLTALAVLWWGLLLLRRIRERYDRILIGLVGLVATYQGLHLAIEPQGWAWFANALGVIVALAAMALLGRLVHKHQNVELALRLSEAREMPPQVSQHQELAPVPKVTKADVHSTILDSTPMAMFAIGLDGCVSFWNSAAERLLGWSSEEVVGYRMPNLIAHSKGGLFDGEPLRLVRKDGGEVTGPVQSVPVRDARGAVSGILTIVTPIAQ